MVPINLVKERRNNMKDCGDARSNVPCKSCRFYRECKRKEIIKNIKDKFNTLKKNKMGKMN